MRICTFVTVWKHDWPHFSVQLLHGDRLHCTVLCNALFQRLHDPIFTARSQMLHHEVQGPSLTQDCFFPCFLFIKFPPQFFGCFDVRPTHEVSRQTAVPAGRFSSNTFHPCAPSGRPNKCLWSESFRDDDNKHQIQMPTTFALVSAR